MSATAVQFEDTRLRPTRLKNWIPKTWRVEYEKMVALSVIGLSNKMIAQKMDYTPVHVSNILNMDQAEMLRQQLLAKMREGSISGPVTEIADIGVILSAAALSGAKRIKTFIENDDRFENQPLAVVDRSFELLKGLKHLKTAAETSGGNGTQIGAIVIGGQVAQNLMDGLVKANNVRKLHEVVPEP